MITMVRSWNCQPFWPSWTKSLKMSKKEHWLLSIYDLLNCLMKNTLTKSLQCLPILSSLSKWLFQWTSCKRVFVLLYLSVFSLWISLISYSLVGSNNTSVVLSILEVEVCRFHAVADTSNTITLGKSSEFQLPANLAYGEGFDRSPPLFKSEVTEVAL